MANKYGPNTAHTRPKHTAHTRPSHRVAHNASQGDRTSCPEAPTLPRSRPLYQIDTHARAVKAPATPRYQDAAHPPSLQRHLQHAA
eukprot:3894801-Prymnesium_polylepis.1